MVSTRIGPRPVVAALAVVVVLGAWLTGPVRAAEDDASMRKQLLALNEITGEDAMTGEKILLLKDPVGTKKLLDLAAQMVKEPKPPFNFNAALILGQVAEKLKQDDTSLALYRLCAQEATKLKSATKIALAYGGMISVYEQTHKYKECEKLCLEILEMRGDTTLQRVKAVVLRHMIQAVAKQGRTNKALELIDDVIKNNPDNWLMVELRGWVQREAGQYAEAAKTYQEVLDRVLKDPDLEKDEKVLFVRDIRYILSGVYIDANQVNKAADQLKDLLKDDPDNPGYNNDLGYIWADHDMNLPEAEKLIRKAMADDRKQRLKDNPEKPDQVKDNAAYLDSLGWVLYKQKKYAEAKKFLEQAIKEPEGLHVEILDHLAEVYLALGDKNTAIATWKKGIEVAGPSKREQQQKATVEKKIKAQK